MLIHLCAAILHIPHISCKCIPVNIKKKAASVRSAAFSMRPGFLEEVEADQCGAEKDSAEEERRDEDGERDGLEHRNLLNELYRLIIHPNSILVKYVGCGVKKLAGHKKSAAPEGCGACVWVMGVLLRLSLSQNKLYLLEPELHTPLVSSWYWRASPVPSRRALQPGAFYRKDTVLCLFLLLLLL